MSWIRAFLPFATWSPAEGTRTMRITSADVHYLNERCIIGCRRLHPTGNYWQAGPEKVYEA